MKWKLFIKVIGCRKLKVVKVYDESGNFVYEKSYVVETYLQPKEFLLKEIEPTGDDMDFISRVTALYDEWKWQLQK